MGNQLLAETAATTPTRFLETGGRRLAYRKIGEGYPLILALRFRGVLDSWDPLFLDTLAQGRAVVTFDYSGMGASTGSPSYQSEDLAQDIIDLADALGIERFDLGGWSIGGTAAQVVAALHHDRVRHLVLIGTAPPGRNAAGAEPVFYERALKPVNDLDDETVLFFEPDWAESREAARQSRSRIESRIAGDRSPPIPPELFLPLLKERAETGGGDLFADRGGYRDKLAKSDIPILVVSGDHEIVFPAQNWFDVVRDWQSLHLVVLPRMGHGPQQQAPEFVGRLIDGFLCQR